MVPWSNRLYGCTGRKYATNLIAMEYEMRAWATKWFENKASSAWYVDDCC
jgi:hypothetical protein